MNRSKFCAIAACAAVSFFPQKARATYSVVAADQATGQVGGAGTSCVGSMDVFVIYGSAPGLGAVHAQAFSNPDGRDEAVRLLQLGTAPADIITAITDLGFDPLANSRQYGVVDIQGRAAAWTGSSNGDWAGDLPGQADTFTYSVQGNILTSEAVVTMAATGFAAPESCDLAERLISGLEGGARGGGGDSRCAPLPSDSGFVHVDLADGTVYLHISVTDSGNESPLIALRQQFNAWRAQNPCPGELPDAGVEPDGATDGGAEPGPDGAAVHDAAQVPDAGGDGNGGGGGWCQCRFPGNGSTGGTTLLFWLTFVVCLVLIRRRFF